MQQASFNERRSEMRSGTVRVYLFYGIAGSCVAELEREEVVGSPVRQLVLDVADRGMNGDAQTRRTARILTEAMRTARVLDIEVSRGKPQGDGIAGEPIEKEDVPVEDGSRVPAELFVSLSEPFVGGA
jgi:hypothetical protein